MKVKKTISLYCPKCKTHTTFEVFERFKPYILHPHMVKCIVCNYMSSIEGIF